MYFNSTCCCQKFVHKLVNEHLDIAESYQPQDESLWQAIRNAVSALWLFTTLHYLDIYFATQAMNTFPQLFSYESCWPVNDLMILHLKNTSRHEKLKLEKAAGHKGKCSKQ